jgi:BirA family biotin operon repressor/biotin-[acetyl-CoA-carboxylase] ligase
LWRIHLPWHLAIAQGLSLLPPDWLIEKRDEIASTNSELMGRARAGDTRPTLLVAKHQTAGRGRLGRQWHDRPGDTLMFSLGLEMSPLSWSGLSLAVGLSIANSLDPQQHLGLGLKWPNDLWLGPLPRARKLGGILIETAVLAGAVQASRYVVVGVGINIKAPPSEGLSMPAVGWAEVQAQANTDLVLQALLLPLVAQIQRFEREGFAPLQAAYAQRDLLQGQALALSNGLTGVGAGVDGQGVLQLDTATGRVGVASDEVSVRPGTVA